VQALKELHGQWPPILVATADRSVVDGLHRVHAARALGLSRLPCEFFAGTESAAYEEFVRRNTSHGLPLSLREREQAARRILQARPELADRRIASTCALSPTTVARLRREDPRPTARVGQLHTRVGRDGRARPVDHGVTRARVAEALRDHPGESLRAVAARVGVSPTTVRSVRTAIAAGADQWAPDRAVLSTEAGTEFAGWFERTAVDDEWWTHVASVPYSRIYAVADEARRRAAMWTEFARALEARAHAGG
jgi:ParB-like chromosome segregation protein Spo0J